MAKAKVESNVDTSRSPIAIPYAILMMLGLLGGVATILGLTFGGTASAGGTGDAVPAIANANATSFSETGPFGVGLMTTSLPQNGAAVTIWYPANADAAHGVQTAIKLADILPASILKAYPALQAVRQTTFGQQGLAVADGKFPIVVFSHGFAGFPTQSARLTAHLASWGFVVAAPDHKDRDLSAVAVQALTGQLNEQNQINGSNDVQDLENTISLLERANTSPTSIFYRHLDTSRIGAVGHSAGGSAVEKLAVADSRVRVWIGLAGASFGSFGETASGLGAKVPRQAGLLMYGEMDGIVSPGSIKNAYNALSGPKRLIGIADAGHLVFTDICTFGHNAGGIIGLADKVGLPLPAAMIALGTDGCSAAFAPISSDQPLINQAVTAELRWQMGFDANQNALSGLETAFGWRVLQNTTATSVPGAMPESAGQ